MLISSAMAAAEAVPPEAPSAFEAFALNMLLIIILVVLFYVLLIMPQQKRFKKHKEMIDALKKGDKVVTSGGFIGKIDKIDDDKNEVVIDLGGDVKIRAMRSAIQNKYDLAQDTANANKKADTKDTKKDAEKDAGKDEKSESKTKKAK